MAAETVYAIHWHQKQRNAHQADDLIWALEGYREAVFKVPERGSVNPSPLGDGW